MSARLGWTCLSLVGLGACANAQTPGVYRFEAETGQLHGVEIARERAGFGGEGYVTGFDADDDRVTLRLDAPAGLYELRLIYATPNGQKGYELELNGLKLGGMLPAVEGFGTASAGRVRLTGGDTLIVAKGWGWWDLDAVELRAAQPAPPPRKPPATPVDPAATPAARALFAFLVDSYGGPMLSGQTGLDEAAGIEQRTGVSPAVVSGDFMDYSPSRTERGSKPEGTTESYVKAGLDGRIVSMLWHWNAPRDLIDREWTNDRGERVNALWWRGFYTSATTFDVAAALADPNGEAYRLLLRDIDVIAAELRKFADADVPVLWRPLHEAEGRWFWWGARGPEPFRQLWRLLFDRLTRHHGLHNLIWVLTTSAEDWYPGDDVVDVLGVDAYPPSWRDPLSGTWDDLQRRFDGRKLLALTEFGGVPDVAAMHAFGVRWSYFVSWTGTMGPRALTDAELREVYQSASVMDAGELRSRRQPHQP